MKHLKKIFEKLSNEDKEIIEAICYDLTDDGEFEIKIDDYKQRNYRDDKTLYGIGVNVRGDLAFVLIEKRPPDKSKICFDIKEVIETIKRIENYIGDKHIITLIENDKERKEYRSPYLKLVNGKSTRFDEYKYNHISIDDVNRTETIIIWFKV